MKIILLLFLFPSLLFAADISHIETVNPGDPIWVSQDGQTWQETTLIHHNISPLCDSQDVTDKDGHIHKIYQCEKDFEVEHRVWYSGSFEGPINYITGRDPDRTPVSRSEMFGLQNRIKNILFADDLESALGTVKEFYADRNRLIEVHEAVREDLLKQE